ncbi:MAG: ATP-dependent DNA helicase RecG [Bacillales bacterium]|jgi:ATP-dependent DNA helicase RecG|nr:ATP-dependent DNA helicase RecG [Bacillales bacterium]
MRLTNKRIAIINALEISLDNLPNYFPYAYEIYEPSNFNLENDSKRLYILGKVINKGKFVKLRNNISKWNFALQTETNIINCIIFNQDYLYKLVFIGAEVLVKGKINYYESSLTVSKVLTSLDKLNSIEPVYSLRKGLKNFEIHNLIKLYLEEDFIGKEIIPNYYQQKYKLIKRKEAYNIVHNPLNKEELFQAKRYFKYEEILLYCLKSRLLNNNASQLASYKKNINRQIVKKVFEDLPYQMTDDQIKALKEIYSDLESDRLMSRLLQGDVGSGKTLVAAFTAIGVCSAGYQTALLAPTEVLARQHYDSFLKLVGKYYKVELLVASLSNKEKNIILDRLEGNDIDILIGTHSLISDNVIYYKLGLAIIDEQQRFGVLQRQNLLKKGDNIDFLTLSATPIPRTLAIAISGSLQVSTLYQFPLGLKDIETKVLKSNSIKPLIKQIEGVIKEGKQIFIVAPLISDSTSELRSTVSIVNELQTIFQNKYIIGQLHGKLSDAEKVTEMDNFKNGLYNILVTTTVIEVGVDIPNAVMMIIYNAERFGLSQLHQLRGRIGRDGSKGYAYLLTQMDDEQVLERLQYLATTNDGFKIAEYDLENRGPGQMFGENQSGLPNFQFFDYKEDLNILKHASLDAKEIVDKPSYENSIIIDYVTFLTVTKLKSIE